MLLKICSLSVENLESECITDNLNPSISYYLESNNKGVEIVSALVIVGDWKIKTTSQTSITYNGPKLKPFTKYSVHLVVTDNFGEIAEAETSFETGRLDTPWEGKWITDGSYKFTGSKNSPKTMTFKKSLNLNKEVVCATLYSTALGIYELMLNGEKVGKDYFAPGFTSYKNQIQYQIYDITSQLKKHNDLLAIVGGGWAVGPFTYARRNRVFAKRQALLCEIRVKYADGTEEIIPTDTSWSVTEDGNFCETEFYNGEVYDATISIDDAYWKKTTLEHIKINPKIVAQYGLPVREQEIFKPVESFKAKSGMTIFNFGQNFAGVIRAKIKNGKKGQVIIFKHSEILMDGELFTEPLRSAKQEAVYTCVNGDQSYSPKMTYMGFQYVGVYGIKPEDLEIEGVALYSDLKENGDFTCSNNQLNKPSEQYSLGSKIKFCRYSHRLSPA